MATRTRYATLDIPFDQWKDSYAKLLTTIGGVINWGVDHDKEVVIYLFRFDNVRYSSALLRIFPRLDLWRFGLKKRDYDITLRLIKSLEFNG